MLGNGIFNLKVAAVLIIHKLYEEVHLQKMTIKLRKEYLKIILNQEIEELKHRNYNKCLY